MLPDDEYLLRLGRVTYTLTRLETTTLRALGQLPGLPPALQAHKLSGKTLDAIARAMADPANTDKIADPTTRALLASAAEDLAAAARTRRAITHARAAHDDEEQRLHRRQGTHADAVDITTAWLDRAQAELDDAARRIPHARPAEAA